LTIEWGANASPRLFRTFDASQPSSNDKTLLVLDKLRSPDAAVHVSYGASVLAVICITILCI
jgi:hypothetical protein